MTQTAHATGLAVELSTDLLEACLVLPPAADTPAPGYDALCQALADAGVVFGIDLGLLRDIAGQPRPGQSIAVARGKAARAASDETLVLHFHAGGPPRETDHGGVNFRELGTFNNFAADEVLASKAVTDPGAPGINVLGEEIPFSKGKELRFQLGRGAKLSDDGQQVLAEFNGHACLVNNRISVIDTIQVQGDVDFGVGNIDFAGHVKIAGSVNPGFSVSAQGDLEIHGNVEQADIACGGNLTINGLVFGHGHCQIKCRGAARIGALDQASVEVGGALTVDHYIRHCLVQVGDSLELLGRKGTIVGGEISVFHQVLAACIGSPMATMTKLNLGINPFAASEIQRLDRQTIELRGKLEQVEANINGLLRLSKCNSQAASRHAETLAKLSAAKTQLDAELAGQLAAHAELRRSMHECISAQVKASDRIFPGVLLTFRGRYMYKTTDLIQFVAITENAGEVQVGAY
jgi:uncharacterized protein (DUF342 family)